MCRSQLGVYLQKYRNKLKGKNRVYIAQLIRVVDSLSWYLDDRATSSKSEEGIATVSSLMGGKGVDQINLHKLVHYLDKSKLARKVEGYIKFAEDLEESDPRKTAHNTPAVTKVQEFIHTLANPASEGRFFLEKDEDEMSLKYMLLDPTCHFRDIVEEARSVILAGGTMSPVSLYLHSVPIGSTGSSHLDPKTCSCIDG